MKRDVTGAKVGPKAAEITRETVEINYIFVNSRKDLNWSGAENQEVYDTRAFHPVYHQEEPMGTTS